MQESGTSLCAYMKSKASHLFAVISLFLNWVDDFEKLFEATMDLNTVFSEKKSTGNEEIERLKGKGLDDISANVTLVLLTAEHFSENNSRKSHYLKQKGPLHPCRVASAIGSWRRKT